MKLVTVMAKGRDEETCIRLDCIAACSEHGIFLTGGQFIPVANYMGAFEEWELFCSEEADG